MKPVVFNFNDSCLNRTAEAIALKTGYLLGDEVYAAGNTEMNLLMGKYTSNYSISRKLDLLEKRFLHDAEMLPNILEWKKIKKANDKVKFKVPGHLAAQKKAEQSTHDFWAAVIKYMDEEMNGYGFEALRDLDDDVLKYYMINIDSSETAGKGNLMVSDLMQRLLPDLKEEEEPEIFFLQTEFFSDDYAKPFIHTADSEAVLDLQSMYLHKCLSLPYINTLWADELKAVRQQVQPACAPFRNIMNEWIDMCYFGDAIPDRTQFFMTDVLPAAAALQQSLDTNDTLELCTLTQSDTEKMEVWIGEMPVYEIWNFYRHHDVIKDSTWDKMETLKSDGVYNNERWPVMILNTPEHMLQQPEEEEPEEITATRKYISID